ncbi:hypothetical protein [Streptomyces sp. NRRL B-1347]|uniref:hypothetical protein n=1 Tax=Streptomyces sp. NRRL B-1347 TaxID=1476877 RepID=UPI0004C92D39|nr:hypothetical protein [Streptomyces sp. NRRL B-1347]
MTERIHLKDLTDDALDRLRECLAATEDAVARARDAATLHRQGLLTTPELYAVMETLPAPSAAATQATEPSTSPLHDRLAAAISPVLDEHPEHNRTDEHEHVLNAITTAVLDVVLPHSRLLHDTIRDAKEQLRATRTREQVLEHLHEENTRRHTAAIARVGELLAENAELVRQRAKLLESNTEQRAVIERVRAALRNPGALGWRHRIRVALAGTPLTP